MQRISYSFHWLVVRCLNRATRLQTTPPERNRSAVLLCYLKVCSVEKQTKDSVASWRLLLFCFCLSQVKHNLVSTQILCKRILEWTRFLTFYFFLSNTAGTFVLKEMSNTTIMRLITQIKRKRNSGMGRLVVFWRSKGREPLS